MKKKYMTFLVLVAAFSLTGIGTARASDFRFTVPIQLNNIHPDVTHVHVGCGVGIGANFLMNTTATGSGGSSMTMASHPDGNVAENVTVQFDAGAGKNPSDATHYKCRLRLVKGPLTIDTGTTSSTPIWARANSNEPFQGLVQGSLN